MMDNEIIKALERMSAEDADGFSSDILDLIKRQQAEIERFTKRQKPTAASGYKVENGKIVFYTNMLEGCHNVYESLDDVAKTLNELLQECYDKDEIVLHLKNARAEAIRGFAERLHKKADVYDDGDTWFYFIDPDEIDNLVKEMVGENNG